MLRRLNRREALTAGAGAFAAGLGLTAGPAHALNDFADQIKTFTGGKAPVEGRVRSSCRSWRKTATRCRCPSPSTERWRATPMCRKSWWSRQRTERPGDPVRFSPASVPEASTRIRLAETQDVIAVAKLSDGSFFRLHGRSR